MNVRLVGHTQFSEQLCAEAAKVCYSKHPFGMPEAMKPDKVVNMLEQTIESGHESIIEHASFTFAIDGVSRALSHQLVRHRIASFSQQSQRYVEMTDFKFITPESIKNADDGKAIEVYNAFMDNVRETYHYFTDTCGIPPEDARFVLPNAATTNLVMTMNARELLHFFETRMCNRAQWEIREMARRMYQECITVAPSIFRFAGPNCWFDGCKEKKPCGKPRPINPLDDVALYGTLFC